jgi:hypothetical protein
MHRREVIQVLLRYFTCDAAILQNYHVTTRIGILITITLTLYYDVEGRNTIEVSSSERGRDRPVNVQERQEISGLVPRRALWALVFAFR